LRTVICTVRARNLERGQRRFAIALHRGRRRTDQRAGNRDRDVQASIRRPVPCCRDYRRGDRAASRDAPHQRVRRDADRPEERRELQRHAGAKDAVPARSSANRTR
jgi:hypothetical protein